MAYNSPADNYVRAFTAAFTIVAGQDTTDDSVKDVAATVGALAKKLYKQQNDFVEAEGFTSETPKFRGKKSSAGSSESGSESSGLTPKQRSTVPKAILSLGDDTPYTLEDITEAQGKERSEMIGKVFDAAYGDK